MISFLISCSKKENQEFSIQNLSNQEYKRLVIEAATNFSLKNANIKLIDNNLLEQLDICDPSDDPNLPSQGCLTFSDSKTLSIPALFSCPGCNSAKFSYSYKICILPNNTVKFIVFNVRFEEAQSSCSQAFWDCYSNLSPQDYLVWIEQMKQFVAFEIEKDLAQQYILFIPNCNVGSVASSAAFQSAKCWRICVPPIVIPPVPYVVENCGHVCCTETRTFCKHPVTGEIIWSTPTYNVTTIGACGPSTPICGNTTPCYVLTCGEVIEIE